MRELDRAGPAQVVVERRKARLLRGGAMLSAPAAAALAALRFLVDGVTSTQGWVLLGGAAGFAAVVLLHRVSGSTRGPSWMITGVAFATLSAMAFTRDGLWSDAVLWMPFVPFVGTLFLGRAGALAGGAAGALALTALAALHYSGGLTPRPTDGELLLRHGAAVGALVFAAGLATLAEAVRIRAQSESERMKDEFVSVVSHELRTPLTSISGSLRLVTGGVTGELQPKTAEMLELANRNATRLRRLIDDLLDLQKLAAGRMELERSPHPVSELIDSAIESDQEFARVHDVTVRSEGDLPHCQIEVDPHRFHQVLANLISNAVKHSPSGEVVEITAKVERGEVTVSVADRGPGIPDEFRSRIFQPFAQADGSSERSVGGTGLGLAISRRLIELHGGAIDFDPRPGGGTTFRVVIPAVEET